jgi:hypothetical protein
MGIEPTLPAWKAGVLPLNYTRVLKLISSIDLLNQIILMVGKTGFEPATPWSQTRCSTKLSHFPFFPVSPKRSQIDWTNSIV